MKNALLYLALQSRANSLRALLLRLRQPRYAIGALLIAAYVWFLLLRRLRDPGAAAAALGLGGTWSVDFAAFLLFVLTVGGWILGGRKATLNFSEAEAAWLFPAPLSRRTLVHFKLLQLQLGILFSALVLTALSSGEGTARIPRFGGIWIVLSFLQLHGVAGAFTRERLAALGLDPFRRRIAIGVLLLGLTLATWLSARAGFAGPSGLLADFVALLSTLLATPPLGWVLAPFRLAVAPMHAASGSELFRAWLPALALLAAHYVWAMRAIVGFEEASAAQAEKRAIAVRAMRGGQRGAFLRPRKAQSEPFALAPQGRPEIAFLWQRLIAAGAWAFPRSLLTAAAIPIGVAAWLRGSAEWAPSLGIVSFVAAIIAAQLLLLGPVLARGSLAQLFERIDVVKTYPLNGWQVVLGELLGPSAILSALELTLLSLAALGAGRVLGDPEPTLALAGWIAAMALVPPFAGLLFGAQLGVLLALPAWFRAGASATPGLEQMGQQLVFMFVSLLVFIGAILPAGLAAALAYFVAQALTGSLAVSITCAGLAGAAELSVMFAAMVWWLGRRFDRLDLALDLAH